MKKSLNCVDCSNLLEDKRPRHYGGRCASCYQKHHLKKERARIAINPEKSKYQIASYLKKRLSLDPMYSKWIKKKNRAKNDGVLFTIQLKDLPNPPPEFCPVLGIRLKYGIGPHDHGATIDRVNSSFGYMPGNVAIISNRANRIKSSSTPSELRLIADWIERHQNANKIKF